MSRLKAIRAWNSGRGGSECRPVRITVEGSMGRHLAAILVLGLLAGCGGEGGGGGFVDIPDLGPGPAPTPPPDSSFQAPRAAAASGAVDLATEAATNVILDPFTQGEASGAPHVFLSPASFEFSSHVEFEI